MVASNFIGSYNGVHILHPLCYQKVASRCWNFCWPHLFQLTTLSQLAPSIDLSKLVVLKLSVQDPMLPLILTLILQSNSPHRTSLDVQIKSVSFSSSLQSRNNFRLFTNCFPFYFRLDVFTPQAVVHNWNSRISAASIYRASGCAGAYRKEPHFAWLPLNT